MFKIESIKYIDQNTKYIQWKSYTSPCSAIDVGMSQAAKQDYNFIIYSANVFKKFY